MRPEATRLRFRISLRPRHFVPRDDPRRTTLARKAAGEWTPLLEPDPDRPRN